MIRLLQYLLVVWLVMVPAPLLAQRSSSGKGPVAPELAIFGGGVFGNGSHRTIGGSVGIAIKSRWVALFEYAHTPTGLNSFYRPPCVAILCESITDSRESEFSAVGHGNFSSQNARLVPYGLGGVGRLKSSADVSGTMRRFTPDGVVRDPYVARRQNDAWVFQVGGGLRLYMSDRWGLRPEVKFFVGGQRRFTRASMGIFYQWR